MSDMKDKRHPTKIKETQNRGKGFKKEGEKGTQLLEEERESGSLPIKREEKPTIFFFKSSVNRLNIYLKGKDGQIG